jgi:aminoglycoside phosphotransferase (APT) family kinase protein
MNDQPEALSDEHDEQNAGQKHERRSALIHLGDDTIYRLLEPAFPGCRILSCRLLTGGYANTLYKIAIAAPERDLVLRIYTRDPASCPKETAIARLVEGHVPIPSLIYADCTGQQAGHPYSVMEWIDGISLDSSLEQGDVAAIGECAYAAGATLATIGTFTFPATGFLGPDLSVATPFAELGQTTQDYIRECLFTGHAGEKLGSQLTDTLWRLVETKGYYLQDIPPQARLVHADYKGQNLLMRLANARWQMAAVLDWEFAFAGTPLIDIGIALRFLDQLPAIYSDNLIRGFTENGGILPATWKPISKLLDLINLCDFLNSPEPRPILTAQMRERIQNTIATFRSEGW